MRNGKRTSRSANSSKADNAVIGMVRVDWVVVTNLIYIGYIGYIGCISHTNDKINSGVGEARMGVGEAMMSVGLSTIMSIQ